MAEENQTGVLVPTDAISVELEQIQGEMADRNSGYWKSPARQQRFRELTEARQGGTPPPVHAEVLPAGSKIARLQELETMMKDRYGPYWHSPALQDEYLRLVAGEIRTSHAFTPPADAPRLSDAERSTALSNVAALGDAGARWAAEMSRSGDLSLLEFGDVVRQQIVADLGPSGAEVGAAFDGLSDAVRVSFYREIGNAYAPRQPPASRADTDQFAATDAGRILKQQWGQDVPRKLATVLYRWDRFAKNLSAAEFSEIDDFYRNRLRPHEKAAILRRLAG